MNGLIETPENALKTLFHFRELTDLQREALAKISHVKALRMGELAFREGDTAHAFYVVLSGQMQIYKLSAEGKELILHIFKTGDIFAEMPVFHDIETYPANALALEDTVLLAINGYEFRALIQQHPEVALRMLGVMAKKLREFSELIEDLGLRSVDERVARYLISVSEAVSDKALISVHKKTLAAMLGTVPETLSRAFRKLSAAKIIRVEQHRVHILDRQRLLKLAE